MFRKTWLLVIVLVVACVVPAPFPAPSRAETVAQTEPQECIVYVTQSGNRYHVDDCRLVRYSKIPMSKAGAEARGYVPCRVCGGSDC
jgi:hypothetical protein